MGTALEVDGRTSKDGRGSDFAGCSSTAGMSEVGLDIDSDGGSGSGGGGGGGSIREGLVSCSCRGNGSTGIAGNCGGLFVIQGGREVSILEIVLLLPCRFPFPLSFGVGVVVRLSLSDMG